MGEINHSKMFASRLQPHMASAIKDGVSQLYRYITLHNIPLQTLLKLVKPGLPTASILSFHTNALQTLTRWSHPWRWSAPVVIMHRAPSNCCWPHFHAACYSYESHGEVLNIPIVEQTPQRSGVGAHSTRSREDRDMSASDLVLEVCGQAGHLVGKLSQDLK